MKTARQIERILKWTGYKVKAKKDSGYACPWDKKHPYEHFRYRVYLASPDGEKAWFTYWGSNAEYWEDGTLTAGEMIGGWLHDSDYAEESFESFCDNIDGNTDSIANLRMYQACARIKRAADRIFPGKIRQAIMRRAWGL